MKAAPSDYRRWFRNHNRQYQPERNEPPPDLKAVNATQPDELEE
jgi:hypothetical protein